MRNLSIDIDSLKIIWQSPSFISDDISSIKYNITLHHDTAIETYSTSEAYYQLELSTLCSIERITVNAFSDQYTADITEWIQPHIGRSVVYWNVTMC